ncbi:hypothetical protein CALCODRAFT_555749 [Calocera cornea HHB12733]|uniref:Afadin and alpha-actinin-binding-domain-containing protein n=1 Tax=Calocera cornea HHB12733 TaxID=1353952 RepID=A0A165FJ33_9BASI|nr:hypothetical protein CALCODRAFT_555749 [Calocera cornea HHB12733]
MTAIPPTPGRVRFLSPPASSPASTSTASASTSATSNADYTSSLSFLTTQLQSHGFLPPSSLLSHSSALAQLPADEQHELQKCLMGMLQQRVEDMERLEEAGAEMRRGEWEGARWKGVAREEQEGRERAEREREALRARMSALAKTLSLEHTSHKQTTTQLQRAQSSLQTARAHAQAELRKREKEAERMGERLARVASEQARLGALGSGLRLQGVLSASTVSLPTDALLETQLRETEDSRARLVEENDALRSALLTAANALQSLAVPGAAPMLGSALFTPGMMLGEGADWQAENARTKLLELCARLREKLANPSTSGSTAAGNDPAPEDSELAIAKDEVQRLAGNVRRLEEELSQARGREERGQKMMEMYAMQATRGRGSDVGLDSPQVSKKAALDAQALAIEQERAQLTTAAVELGKERAELQRQRAQLDEERRKAALRALLDDLPPTPTGMLPSSTPAVAIIRASISDDEDVLPEPQLRTPSPAPRHRRKRRSQSPAAGKRSSLSGAHAHGKGKRPAVFPRKSAMRAAADWKPAVGSPLKAVTTFAASSSSAASERLTLSVASLGEKGKERARGEKENAPPLPLPSFAPSTPLPRQSLRASRDSTLRPPARESVGPQAGAGRDSMRLSASHLVGGGGMGGRRKSVLGGGAQRVWRG